MHAFSPILIAFDVPYFFCRRSSGVSFFGGVGFDTGLGFGLFTGFRAMGFRTCVLGFLTGFFTTGVGVGSGITLGTTVSFFTTSG